MALVQLKWALEVGIADNSGDISPRFYEAPEAAFADYDAALINVNTLITALNAMTQGVIANYRLAGVYVEDALALPASGVENENQAFFSGKIDGDPTDSATQSIPAADPAIFVNTVGPGANVVDMNDGAVLTWIGLFDASGPWTISDGESWVTATIKGALVIANRSYTPDPALMCRCEGYLPKASDNDQRTGTERWPGLMEGTK